MIFSRIWKILAVVLGIFLLLILFAVYQFWSFLPLLSALYSHGTVLITLHNNAELRPSLGFLTGFFLLKNEGDGIRLEFYDSYDVAPPKTPYEIPKILQQQGWKEWLFRDSNMSMDFANNAQQAIAFLQEDPRFANLHYTAVIGVDTTAIASVIDAVSGIWFNGKTITSDTFFSLLSQQSRDFVPLSKADWLERKSGIAEMGNILFKKIILSPFHWDSVAEQVAKSFKNQHILIWMANNKTPPWGGSVVVPQHHIPYGTFFTNVGGKKSDRYVEKKITSTFSVNDVGEITETVHISVLHSGTRSVFSDRYFAEVALIRPSEIQIASFEGPFENVPQKEKDGTVRFFFWVDQSHQKDFLLRFTYPQTITASFVTPLSFFLQWQPGADADMLSHRFIFQGAGQTFFTFQNCTHSFVRENISWCTPVPNSSVHAFWNADTTPPFLEEVLWQDDRKTLRIQFSEEIMPITASQLVLVQGENVISPLAIRTEPMAVVLQFADHLPMSDTEKYKITVWASDLFSNQAEIVGAIR